MKEIIELEEYVRDVLEIPHVCFNGLDLEVCKVIVETLKEVFRKFPFLKHTLSAIGNRKYIIDYMNLDWYADYEFWSSMDVENLYCTNLFPRDALATLSVTGGLDNKNKGYKFLVLSLGDYICSSNLEMIQFCIKRNVENRKFHKYHNSLKTLLYHELGHLLDFSLWIHETAFFEDWYQKNLEILREQLSITAYMNKKEFWAEAFSYYYCGDESNDLVNKTIELVKKHYNDFIFTKEQTKRLNFAKQFRFK